MEDSRESDKLAILRSLADTLWDKFDGAERVGAQVGIAIALVDVLEARLLALLSAGQDAVEVKETLTRYRNMIEIVDRAKVQGLNKQRRQTVK